MQALGEGVLIVAEALLHLALAGAEGVGQPRHAGVRLRPLAAPAAKRQGDERGERDGEDDPKAMATIAACSIGGA